jgi:hypothetical protein
MVTVLGRDDNVRAATGVRRIHVAGTRAWQPVCVVAADGTVHALPFTWDRDRLAAAVEAVIGDADRVEVDGCTPWWRDRLQSVVGAQRLTITAEPWPNKP